MEGRNKGRKLSNSLKLDTGIFDEKYCHTPVPLSSHRRLARVTLLGGALLGTSLYLSAKSPLYADHDQQDPKWKIPNVSLGSLIRSYAIYSMCSIPALVDAGPAILKAFTSVPRLKQVTDVQLGQLCQL
ncbi:hypothetical protein JAAARDRAFT_197801 [Jaapia argillacea MUCL 33604]|uniref:Uncharacterized protein n=1 Tax=Jaapia argillacea MUCL 33604 TaxID=933084 RepID=A0A067PRR0_9AGAM|nr:hypothetical protein JAAARDRAFT_197801 [Jaapia argillacea MUCL 33604]